MGFFSRIHATPNCQRHRRISYCNQCALILIWPLFNPAHVILHFHAGMGALRCHTGTSGTFLNQCSQQSFFFKFFFFNHFSEIDWLVEEILGSNLRLHMVWMKSRYRTLETHRSSIGIRWRPRLALPIIRRVIKQRERHSFCNGTISCEEQMWASIVLYSMFA